MSNFYELSDNAAECLERLAGISGKDPKKEVEALIFDTADKAKINEKDASDKYISLFDCESNIFMEEYDAEDLEELYKLMASGVNSEVKSDIITLTRAAAFSAMHDRGEAAERAAGAIDGIITALCKEINRAGKV